MIYPKKIKARKSDIVIKSLLLASVLIGIMLTIINKLTTPEIPWAALANAGIIYSWITVFYSVRKNINIAGHVLLQTLAISALTVYIDYELGFREWSINIAMPIMIIVANVTMLVLTIVSYKKYLKYAIYQVIIVIFSMLPLVFMAEKIVQNKILAIIATSVSIINLIITIMLSAKDVKEAIVRKFHM